MELSDNTAGFSFKVDAPLNMRLDNTEAELGNQTAESLLATSSEDELIRILKEYGEEEEATHIARAIIAARKVSPKERTLQLAEIVKKVKRKKGQKIHPATKTF